MTKGNSGTGYEPHVGYIGSARVSVSNYLFSAASQTTSSEPHVHAKKLGAALMSLPTGEHFKRSQKLTRFLKGRGLTFSKTTKGGGYKIFAVPVTSTPVPLAKSMFNEVERAAQVLIVSLRKVLQSIYGSPSVEQSPFVQSLPEKVRDQFIHAVLKSPAYFPQLHHPVMADYPFFDTVGLDLVLVDEYRRDFQKLGDLLRAGKLDELPTLPFRLLEINAGSPSGASNNSHILEGIATFSPELLDSFDKVLPNDHFQTLAETYASLGSYWTGNKEGVSIVLPPGGGNGATPEIHQLAAHSGIIYADAPQLYPDEEGRIRLRTITGQDPVVTSVYSRINADSILFNLEKGITLRDAESGEGLYLTDALLQKSDKEPCYVTDERGQPIPLESDYAVPKILEAILQKKIYLGGLNRVLDNKILLSTLCVFAPSFYSHELLSLGLNPEHIALTPPETLPSNVESVNKIEKNPDEWVIKAADLSGGTGVHILKTMASKGKRKVILEAKKNPEKFAFQKLVKIARIPVAVKEGPQEYRFANLAADIRMWVFFGAGEGRQKPVLTHNGLVRVASHETGPLSSIVNTSKGGGYAPLIIVDDVNDPQAVSVRDLVAFQGPKPLEVDAPIFVAPQIVQILQVLAELERGVRSTESVAYLLHLANAVRTQMREVLSFLHPQNMEPLNEIIQLLEKRISVQKMAEMAQVIMCHKAALVDLLMKSPFPSSWCTRLAELFAWSDSFGLIEMPEERRISDAALVELLLKDLHLAVEQGTLGDDEAQEAEALLLSVHGCDLGHSTLGAKDTTGVLADILLVKSMMEERFSFHKSHSYLQLMQAPLSAAFTQFGGVYHLVGEHWNTMQSDLQQSKEIPTASLFEKVTGKRLVETTLIPEEFKRAREDWMGIVKSIQKSTPETEVAQAVTAARSEHFKRYPFLLRLQNILHAPTATHEEMIELLSALPYAKYNLSYLAHSEGLPLHGLFTHELRNGRIAILDEETRKSEGLYSPFTAGECFARKRNSYKLLSDSDVFVWVSKELSPFAKLYTMGHELVHFHQIKEVMHMEAEALRQGAPQFAQFLHFYGNFLSVATNTAEPGVRLGKSPRQAFYGLADLRAIEEDSPAAARFFESLAQGNESFHGCLAHGGGLLGLMVPQSNGVRVKALREVIPALENAKNILFAKELGLDVAMDAVSAALPTANEQQVKVHGPALRRAATMARPDQEALRVVANHQLYGVHFSPSADLGDVLRLLPHYSPIYLGANYNSMQQQQQ